jgi:hypothetical protein
MAFQREKKPWSQTICEQQTDMSFGRVRDGKSTKGGNSASDGRPPYTDAESSAERVLSKEAQGEVKEDANLRAGKGPQQQHQGRDERVTNRGLLPRMYGKTTAQVWYPAWKTTRKAFSSHEVPNGKLVG